MRQALLVSTLLLAAFGSPASSATISFSPSSGPVSGTFTVDVFASDLFAGRDPLFDGIISYGFNLTVSDPLVLSFAGATSGPLFDAPSSQPGTDVFAAASGLGIFDPVSEPLLLATLTFNVIGLGPVQVGINTDVNNNLFHGLQYLDSPFQESISGDLSFTAVPEPATFALAGLALVGLIAARRRA